MADTNLIILAEVYAKPGKEQALQQALLDLVGPTRAEAGCLQYDLHSDNNDPSHFFFYERWRSEAALEEHIASPHFRAFAERESELLREPLRVVFGTRLS